MKLFARTAGRSKGSKPRKKRRRGWRWVFAFFLVALPAALAIAVLAFFAIWAQTFDLKRLGTMPERNTVFDVDGKIYSRLAGANRLKVSLKEVSPVFIQALLAREDTRFYEHGGIDWRGVARALVRDIMSGSAKEGASSITQQLARNSLPLGGRTLNRKLLEAMVALRIERNLTKDQILELYVNRIYFGSGCYGVETASQSYFGKNAAKLDLSESALLAGLIRSPNRFSPLKNPKGAAVQRDVVLSRMEELRKITAAQEQQAKHEKINSHPRRLTLIQENYAMDAVQRDLNLLLTPDQIDNGGLFIYTTLDPAVQKAAANAIETQLAKVEQMEPVFTIRSSRNIAPRPTAKTTPCRISKVRSSRSITRAAAFARSSAGAIMRRANSIARSHRPIARSVPPLSHSFTRSLSPMVCCRARRSATGRSSRAKFKAPAIGRREIPMAVTAGSNLFPMG